MANVHVLGGVALAVAPLLVSTICVAQSVSIELVEASAMTLDGHTTVPPTARASSSKLVDRPNTPTHGTAGQSNSVEGRRSTALRESARAAASNTPNRGQNTSRVDLRENRSNATRSAHSQSDIAEHRQEKRGGTQGGRSSTSGKGKGA